MNSMTFEMAKHEITRRVTDAERRHQRRAAHAQLSPWTRTQRRPR